MVKVESQTGQMAADDDHGTLVVDGAEFAVEFSIDGGTVTGFGADVIIITAGVPFDVPGTTNTLKVETV